MLDRQWRKQLEGHLRDRGIGPDQSRRLVEELADHWEDCLLEDPSMQMESTAVLEQRMGRTRDIADAASSVYRRASVAVLRSAAKSLLFLLGPFVLVALILNAYVWTGIGVAKVSGISRTLENDQSLVGAQAILVTVLTYGIHFLPFIAAAALMSWFARRFRLSAAWGWIACGIVAVLALAFVASVSMPTPISRGQFRISFGISRESLGAARLIQFAAPLLMGGLILLRQRRRFDRHDGLAEAN